MLGQHTWNCSTLQSIGLTLFSFSCSVELFLVGLESVELQGKGLLIQILLALQLGPLILGFVFRPKVFGNLVWALLLRRG